MLVDALFVKPPADHRKPPAHQESCDLNSPVVIHYCRTCGFDKPAEQIADALRRELGLSVECLPGFWGCFRIERDGQVFFNRWKTNGWLGRLGFGRTPNATEIVDLLRSHSRQTTSQDQSH